MLERGSAIARPFSTSSDTDATYARYKWVALLGVSFCYLFYYTGRQTFGFAIPGIQKELGLSKEMLGWVSAAMLWAYALGQSVNGNLGDKWGGRAMMLAGAVLSFAANWTTSLATGFVGLLLAWGLNGYFQAMGFAPGSRLLSNWWGTSTAASSIRFMSACPAFHRFWRTSFRSSSWAPWDSTGAGYSGCRSSSCCLVRS